MKTLYSISVLTLLFTLAGPAVASDTDRVAEITQSIIDDFNNGNGTLFSRYLDMDAVMDTAFGDMNSKSARDFAAGFKKGSAQLGPTLQGRIVEPGYAHLVRVHPQRNGADSVIRLAMGDQGFAYLELHFRRDGDQFRIVDFKNFATGDLLSDTARQTYLLLTQDMSLLNRIFGRLPAGEPQKVVKLVKAAKEKNYSKFFAIFESLESKTRAHKLIAVLAIQASTQMGDDNRYMETMSHLVKHHGNDPGIKFLLVDYYFVREEYDEAMTAIDDFAKFLGVEDAGVLALKANTAIFDGDVAAGIEFAAKAASLEPQMEDPYWSMLLGFAIDNQFDRAVQALSVLEEQFQYEFDDASLSSNPDYRPLVASDAYRNRPRR